ncbi:unnamed protein product, partial [Arctogadus glacialis]
TYVKAKDYLKKSLQCLTSDIQSEAEDPIRRKRRPNSRYLQEPAGRVQNTRGPPQHFFEGVDTDDEAPPPPRKPARQSVDVGPDINSEWLFGPSTTQRAQSNGSQRLELLHLDSPQAGHFLQDLNIQSNWRAHCRRGRKGFKEAFKSTVLSDVLFAALQKQLPGTTHIVFSGTLKKWLKYAPEREGGGGRRTNERDQAPQDPRP